MQEKYAAKARNLRRESCFAGFFFTVSVFYFFIKYVKMKRRYGNVERGSR